MSLETKNKGHKNEPKGEKCMMIKSRNKIRRKTISLFVTVCMLFAFLPMHIAKAAQEYTITIGNDTYQTVEGWGLFPYFPLSSLTDGDIETQADKKLFKESGINIFRTELVAECGTSAGQIDSSKLDILANQIKAAASYGVSKYLLTIWSPPTYMKEIIQTGGGSYRLHLRSDSYDTFCSYIIQCLTYLQNQGCTMPTAISLQN